MNLLKLRKFNVGFNGSKMIENIAAKDLTQSFQNKNG
jgi:acetyl-CoA carboxylase beta subunit